MSGSRVTCLISSLRAGGSERVMTQIANAAVAAGDSVTLMTLDSPTAEPFYPVDSRVHLVALGLLKESPNLWSRFINNWNRSTVVRSALQRTEPEVVLSFGTSCNVMASMAADRRWKTVISERLVPGVYTESRSWSLARQRFYGKADLFVAQTQYVADWARGLWPGLAVRVLPNPVLIPELVAPYGGRQKVALSVGRMTYEKGHDVLLRGFAHLLKHDPDWRLVLVGDGPLRPNLEQLARNLDIEASVDFVGKQCAVEPWYAQARIFVLPSRNEGFPNALLEAMAHGCAIVASDCPAGPREILEDLPEAMFANEDDGALGQRLKEVCELEAGLIRADRGRELVLRYDQAGVLDGWLSIWHRSSEEAKLVQLARKVGAR